MPEELADQIPRIHEIVNAYRLPSLWVPGFRADNIIATLTREAREKGWKVVVVSGDTKLMHLVGEVVLIWAPQRGVLYDVPNRQDKYWRTARTYSISPILKGRQYDSKRTRRPPSALLYLSANMLSSTIPNKQTPLE